MIVNSRKAPPFWLTLPSVQFRRSPWFYFKYDMVWAFFLIIAIGLMHFFAWQGIATSWDPILILYFAIFSCVQVWSGVFVHNATHRNFPRPINRLVGELMGALIVSRFASWEILHSQHHSYSDIVGKDPHPVCPSFWRFFFGQMIGNLEPNLHMQYFQRWGDTPQHRRRENFRSIVSFSTMIVLVFFWYTLFGFYGFFAVFVPAVIVGILHVSHFNWITHDAHNPEQNFKPTNFDEGLFWLGNRLFFGIYYHENHHKNSSLFNPMHYDKYQKARMEKKKASAEAPKV